MKCLFGKRIKAGLAAAAAAMLLTAVTALAQTNIEFNLESGNCGETRIAATAGEAWLTASADGINMEKIRWDTDPERLYPRMQGKNLATGWGADGYWMIEFSSEGMSGIALSANMYSTGKAPRDFELYYSLDGVSFTRIDNSKIMLTKEPKKAYDGFRLPDEVCGHVKVYLKIGVCSSTAVNGGDITGIKDGSTYINNIILSCENGAGETDEPGETDKPADDESEEQGKVYYKKRENEQWQRMGKSTGKYLFAVRAYVAAEINTEITAD